MSEDAAMPVDSIVALKQERYRLIKAAADLPVDIFYRGPDPAIQKVVERKRDLLHQATRLFLEIQRLERLNNHA